MILLDTHIVLWWVAGGKLLSARAAREIAQNLTIFVSPVSLWEIATQIRKGRVVLDRDLYDWFDDLSGMEAVAIAPISPQTAIGAGLLDRSFPADPADRLLYSTARELNVPLLSKDAAIGDYARAAKDVKVIW